MSFIPDHVARGDRQRVGPRYQQHLVRNVNFKTVGELQRLAEQASRRARFVGALAIGSIGLLVALVLAS